MRLSYSRIDAFRRCPFQYRLAWVERVAPANWPYTKLANALHLALAAYHRAGPEAPPSVERLLDGYWKAWGGFGRLDAYDQRQHAAGEEILRVYFEKLDGSSRAVYVEAPFEFQLGPHVLFGRLDRVDETPTGLEIVDYKTATTPERQPDTLQLDVYCLGLEALAGRLPARASFYYLRSNERLSFERSRADAEATRTYLEALARALEADWRFDPTPGPACESCQFRIYCPAVTENPQPIPGADQGQLRLDL